MKRCISLVSVLFCIFFLCSCTSNRQAKVPINYYYAMREVEYGSSSGVIAAEVRDARGHTEDYSYLIEQYLAGPRTDEYTSPFPAGTMLADFEIYNSIAHVTLSVHLSLLSGAELTVACTCLAKTVMEMTGVNSVQISAENGLLNNEEYIIMNSDSFVFTDDGAQYSTTPTQPE